MRWVLLGLLIACGQPRRFPETRWESAPPPPKPVAPPPVAANPAAPASLGMRRAPTPTAVAKRVETERALEPWEVCQRETGSTDRSTCFSKCEPIGSPSRGDCISTCAAVCPVGAPH